MKYIDYKKLNRYERKEKLMEYWDLEVNILRGEMPVIYDDRTYIFIRNIRDLDGNIIINPFTGERVESAFCYINDRRDYFENLEEGDRLIFKYESQESSSNEEEIDRNIKNPILIDAESVYLLRDIKGYLKDLNIKELENILNRKISEKHKVDTEIYIEEDLLSLLNESINDFVETSNKRIVELQKKEEETLRRITQNETKLEEQEKDYKSINNKIKQEKDKLEDLNLKLARYKDLGFETKFFSPIKVNGYENEDNQVNIDKRNQSKYIQRYLASKNERALYYDSHVIEKFLIGLHTNQIIVSI